MCDIVQQTVMLNCAKNIQRKPEFHIIKTELKFSFHLAIGPSLPPSRYEYHWADGTNIKKPIKCSAPKYIDYLMTWVQDQLDDETLFPSKIG